MLLTCDVHVEREAIKEAYRLFESVLDAEAPPPADDTTDASAGTAGDALAAELSALQGEAAAKSKSQPRMSIAQTGCKGTIFVKLGDSAALGPVLNQS